jgi:Concanavalin A-like lectin/glucanases superfamily
MERGVQMSLFTKAIAGAVVLLAGMAGVPAAAEPAVALDPPQVSSEDYPDDGQAHGAPGVPGDFTFSSSASVTTYWYRYEFGDWISVAPAAPGEPVTVTLTPQRQDTNRLEVYVQDAEQISDTTTYFFIVAPPAPASGVWQLDETAGTTAEDTSSGETRHPLTVHGAAASPAWSNLARTGGSLRLDGVDDYAAATAPAVSTAGSFSVAAWVRIESLDKNQTVARQAVAGRHGFLLYYSAGTRKWAFERQDPTQSYTAKASSAAPAVAGVWTHLAGVYDASGKQLRLYVNGVLDGSAAYTGADWVTDGPFELGRWSYPGRAGGFYKGRIDQAVVWPRALRSEDLGRLTQVPNEGGIPQAALAGQWTFDEGSGSVAQDASGYGVAAQLGSGASWTTDADGRRSLRVDAGRQGFAAVPRSVVDGRGSFTITAWVRPSSAAGLGPVVAQGLADGSGRESIGLGITPTDPAYWSFRRLNGSFTETVTARSDEALQPGDYGQWRHVAAVYDRFAGRMFLYVDGRLQFTGGGDDGLPYNDPWHARGPMLIGAGLPGTEGGGKFAGDVDNLRVYTGVMTGGAIRLQYLSEL